MSLLRSLITLVISSVFMAVWKAYQREDMDMTTMKAVVKKMREEIEQTQGQNESLRVLITSLTEQLREYGEDATAMAKLADELEKENDRISQAVLAPEQPEEPQEPDEPDFEPSGNEPAPAGQKRGKK